MRLPALAALVLLPLSLLADERIAPPPAPPAEASAPAGPPRFVPAGEFQALPGKHILAASLETDLPAQAIVQVYVKREQFSSVASSELRLVDSQRFILDGKKPAALKMDLKSLLPPAVYDVELVCDSQGQYPAIQQKLAGMGTLRAGFKLSVGTPEEIALEHEWGETRVVGALRRLDEIVGKMKPWVDAPPSDEARQAFWAEQGRRLGWVSDRLEKTGASCPVTDIWYPGSEKALAALYAQVRNLEAKPEGLAEALPAIAEARAEIDAVFAREFTLHTLGDMQHWLVFVHQEYWLNKVHTRLAKPQWEGFKAEQRRRLDELEKHYAGYADPADPVKAGIASHFPKHVPDCAALLRKLQDAWDADLAEGFEKMGAGSREIQHQVQAVFRKAGLKGRR